MKLYYPSSLLSLYIAGVLQTLNRTFLSKSLPTKNIKKYTLIKEVNRSDEMPNYTFGLYKSKGKKYFIKTWHKGLPDLNYFFLLTEITLTNILSSYSTSHVSTPKIIEVIKTNTSVSVVYEYISGKSLSAYPLAVQKKATADITSWLKNTSFMLSPKERNYFPSRPLISYLFLLPIITLIICIKKPASARLVLIKAWQCYTKLLTQKNDVLILAHRDLTPDNIFVKNNQLILMDIESMAFTLPGYDSAFIETHTITKRNANTYKLLKNSNLGLKLYILLHHAIFSGDFFRINSENLTLLNSI